MKLWSLFLSFWCHIVNKVYIAKFARQDGSLVHCVAYNDRLYSRVYSVVVLFGSFIL